MSNFNQDADMQPAPQFGGRGGFRGRGYQQQTFDSPFGGPSQHRGGRGGGFRGNGGYQQNYNNRGRGNWQPRGGRGRGGGGEYRGRGGGGGYGGGRGRGRGGGGGFPRPEEKSSVPARAYVMPAMTRNPWELLEKQYEAELAAKKATSSQ